LAQETTVRLEGSCHCRKTAGGGYAINLGASTHSMKVTGKRYLGICAGGR
jgi:hypothetical protein